MKTILATTAALAVAMLAGCATPPSRIQAVGMPGNCSDLDRATLASLEKTQAAAAKTDTWSFWVIGVTPTLLNADQVKQRQEVIARLKGKCS